MNNLLKPEVFVLTEICTQVRRDIVRMVYEAQSGHPGGSLGCVEYFVSLYFKVLKHDPKKFNISGDNEDMFFLSNGHISPVYYSCLARTGYFDESELSTFRKLNSRLQGHPSVSKNLPGVRLSTGSLGQGLSVAIGAAQSKKLNDDTNIVYCLIGDGESQEGQIWEAAMYASHHKVDNLILTMDLNYKQIDGDIRDVMNPLDMFSKWKSFGWEVLNLSDGNDIEQVVQILNYAKLLTNKDKPIIILMNTTMGKGVDFMENNHNWHGNNPNESQYNIAMNQLETLKNNDY